MPMWLHWVIMIAVAILMGHTISQVSAALFEPTVLTFGLTLLVCGIVGWFWGGWYVRTFLVGK